MSHDHPSCHHLAPALIWELPCFQVHLNKIPGIVQNFPQSKMKCEECEFGSQLCEGGCGLLCLCEGWSSD